MPARLSCVFPAVQALAGAGAGMSGIPIFFDSFFAVCETSIRYGIIIPME